ncbi:MAG TPA: P1 family peptidase [Actinomycetota bacterium]|nr:P1 family peptidase [Actinomycetota bacterium]
MRLRDIGIRLGDLPPGPHNAITDVAGVRVGHTTLIDGDGPLVVGQGPVRTGVTVILPTEQIGTGALFAGSHRLNGNGELTGLEWIRESGLLTTAIAVTNTHSVGVVRDALIAWKVAHDVRTDDPWSLPVVGETWDGVLSDVNGMHVRPEHVWSAIEAAASGPVAEGNVGGGTGMICHGFKGGIGTASRTTGDDGWTVGVLVQANHGRRSRLSIDGVPVGRAIPEDAVPVPRPPASASPPGAGSIIVVVATDAPLLPTQCDRLAQRAALGIGRTGGAGENSSGDLILCFATGNRLGSPEAPATAVPVDLHMLPHPSLDRLFYATIEATEEAIGNALLQAQTMTGRDGIIAHALDPEQLLEVMRRYGRGPVADSDLPR